jgi:nucleotide-binding universal stress UspA family protein
MLSTVIAGVDGLEGGQDAIALARTLAPEAELVLACAYPYDSTRSRFGLLGYGTALKEQTAHDIRRARREAGLDERTRIELIGDTSPGHALQALAERESADLIVVGSSRHGRASRSMFGAGLAAARGATLRVRTAAEDPVDAIATTTYVIDYDELRETVRRDAVKALADAVATVDPEVETDALAVTGDTRHVLDELCGDVDAVHGELAHAQD